jgi:2,4-dienoyl-CoA reductase-like NADH-dependent reductase (Old Yellow Enzyme family)
VIDCSSGGIAGPATVARVKRQPGFQVPYAAAVREQADIKTQAVGLITHPMQAEEILQAGQADLIALGREALYDPYWPRHAAAMLGLDPDFDDWPEQYGWWLVRRARSSEFYQA